MKNLTFTGILICLLIAAFMVFPDLSVAAGAECVYDGATSRGMTMSLSDMSKTDDFVLNNIQKALRMGKYESSLTQIPDSEHHLVLVPDKEASFKEAGNITYWKCETCGRIFLDEKGEREISLEETVIPKLPQFGEETDIAAGVYATVPWRITKDHELIIGIEGQEFTFDEKEWRYQDDYPWDEYRGSIHKGMVVGKVNGAGSLAHMFFACTSMTEVDLSGLNTENVTSLSSFFSYCESLETVDVSGLKTGNVIRMASLFQSCTSLREVDLSGFDTGKVTQMQGMFLNCTLLKKIDLSSFTTDQVQTMVDMFTHCYSLETIGLGPKSLFFTNLPSDNWTRRTLLDGTSSEGPVITNLPDYTGSDPGWYSKAQAQPPTNPTDPTVTNPSDPSDPTDPTGPTVTDPTKPTDPSDPTDPTDPTNPSDPTNPTDPTSPTDPTDPSVLIVPVDPTPTGLERPVLKAKNLKGRKIKLSWSQVEGADGYQLYVKIPGTKRYRLAVTRSAKVKSVTHRGLTVRKKYSYKLRAYKKVDGNVIYSKFSKAVSVMVRR